MHVRVADLDHVLRAERLAQLDQALHRATLGLASRPGEHLLLVAREPH
jgi:hypothetical protein